MPLLSFTNSFCSKLSAQFLKSSIYSEVKNGIHTSSTFNKYVNRWMIRDAKRRKVAEEFAKERININAIRKNTILPKELQIEADKEIAALPVNSSITRLTRRCVVTSRPRGVLRRWRVSRIVWRHLADYNKLSGVQRAMW